MTLWNLTKEKKDDLLRQKDDKLTQLKMLQARTPVSLWKEDLDNLLAELDKVKMQIYYIIHMFNNISTITL